MKTTRRRLAALLLVVAMLLSFMIPTYAGDYWWSEYMANPEEDITAPGVDENGQVTASGGYILLTSDCHSETFLVKDILEYANGLVQEETGDADAYVGLFAFGGDYADSAFPQDTMTILKHAIEDNSPNTVAVYTKGNHEGDADDEAFKAATGMSRIGETAISADGLYYLYSFGMTENQSFTAEDIAALDEYLATHNDKPVFVISHFPIHYLNTMRSTYDETGASGSEVLINVLNKYPQVIFTWGHNHSEADPSYGTVRLPGEIIQYGPDQSNSTEITFTYLSAGGLRSGVNDTNGVLIKVNEDGSVNFRFIDLNTYKLEETVYYDLLEAEFYAEAAGEIEISGEATRGAMDEGYDAVIGAAQVIVAGPKVGQALETEAVEYSDRFDVESIAWSVDGEAVAADAKYDFDTAYTVEVVLEALEGYTFSEDPAFFKTSGVNPEYDGPMGDEYDVGGTVVERVDDDTAVLKYTFAATAAGMEEPAPAATEILDGHAYVLAAADPTIGVSVAYRYVYEPTARGQNYKPRLNDSVVIDGKLASIPDEYEVYVAAKDDSGYILWSAASLMDDSNGENGLTTVSVLHFLYRGGDYEASTSIGDAAPFSNWNVDEEGRPYLNMDGNVIYPTTTGNAVLATADPAECNMRLYDLGEADVAEEYLVVANVDQPVAGAAAPAEVNGNAVTWEPADETFKAGVAYTATIQVELDAPLSKPAAVLARVNGLDATAEVSEDGKTVTITKEFAKTLVPQTALDVTAVKAEALEAGKSYVFVAEGKAITSQSTDGLYLDTTEVTATEAGIEGVTKEMIFTLEDAGDGDFYIKGSEGYLIGKTGADMFSTWGITTTSEPGMKVNYSDGDLLVKSTGVQGPFGPGPGGANYTPNYVYIYNGKVNNAEFNEYTGFEIYEVAAPFADVAFDAYYFNSVVWAAEEEITSGTGGGKFSPEKELTRAEIVTLLYRAAGSPEVTGEIEFVDVAADAWYADAVIWAVEKGITQGTSAGKFSPDAKCSRSQIVTFLYRAVGAPAVDGELTFSDVSEDAWYANAVIWAVEKGITKGTGTNKFSPEDICDRAQAVTFLFRAQ